MRKRLFRSRTERMIAGVCGGVAEYFDVDPVWVRLVMALLVLAKGIGLIMYVIAWIIVPERAVQAASSVEGQPIEGAPATDTTAIQTEMTAGRKSLVAGGILIILGIIFFVQEFTSWLSFGALWAVILILAGIVLLVKGKWQ